MKLFVELVTALAGVTAAFSFDQPADVYVLQSEQTSTSSDIPSLPIQVARLILLQRLSPEGQHVSWDLPDYISNEEAVTYLNKFGKVPEGLFGNAASSNPSQLVVMLEGITPDHAKSLRDALSGSEPSFRVRDALSTIANNLLLTNDFTSVGVTTKNCTFDKSINPFTEQCWSGKSSVIRYDVEKDSSILVYLAENASLLRKLADNGEMETVVIAIPESSRHSQVHHWSSMSGELRRREAEELMTKTKDHGPHAPITPAERAAPFFGSIEKGTIKSCYESQDACVKATGNCSGHGDCLNKYATPDGENQGTCFACQCLGTKSTSGSVTHWGGRTCGKVDVSVPFWLFVGFGIAMVAILTSAIGLLFSVGEEKLPGVIGAGVSRTK